MADTVEGPLVDWMAEMEIGDPETLRVAVVVSRSLVGSGWAIASALTDALESISGRKAASTAGVSSTCGASDLSLTLEAAGKPPVAAHIYLVCPSSHEWML